MTTASTTVNVQGSHNVTAGGDVHFHENRQESDFIEPVIAEYSALNYPTPHAIDQFIDMLKQERLLILHEPSGHDTSKLARHVGWCYLEKIRQQTFTANAPKTGDIMPVLEWKEGSNPRDLICKLHTTTKATLFLLPEVNPPVMFERDIERIKSQLDDREHIVIVTTSSTEQKWRTTRHINWWLDIAEDSLYLPDALASWLVNWLGENESVLPPGLVTAQTAVNQPLYAGKTPLDVVRQVRTFHNLQAFTRGLRGLRVPLTDAVFINMVQEAAVSDQVPLDQQLRTWRASLDPRRQLLALNLSLLGGMYEDQFFAVLERLYRHVWRRRDLGLRAFDYDDLLALEPWVDLIDTRPGVRFVTLELPEQRGLLLREFWQGQRRQILASLPTLADLVRHSVLPYSHDLELFSRDGRREVLRDVVGETLSDLGLINEIDVQKALIDLAADRHPGVQYVAASAMARWREYGEDDRLLRTLNEWNSGERKDLFRLLVGQRGRTDIGYDAVIATVALTVGIAARYDPPNDLDQRLKQLFETLTRSESNLVRNYLLRYALPHIVERHLLQTRKMISAFTKKDEERAYVIAGLRHAYRTVPKEVVSTLVFWYHHCKNQRPPQPNRMALTAREALLLTVLTLFNDCAAGTITGLIDPARVLDLLPGVVLELFGHEHQPDVRAATLKLLKTLIRQHFQRIEHELPAILNLLPDSSRRELVPVLSELYQQQRGALVGASRQVKAKGKLYGIWPGNGSRRPRTSVETAVIRYLKDASNPHAQSLALQSQVAFAEALDLELGLHQDPSATYTDAVATWGIPPSESWYCSRVVPLLATLGAPAQRDSVRSLMAETLSQHKDHTKATDYSLRWWGLLGDWRVQRVGECLQYAIWWAEQWWLALAAAIVFAALVVVLCVSVLT